MNHYSSTQLQEYLDSLLNEQDSKEAKLHLKTCHECSMKMKLLKEFELSLRSLPLERTSNSFTEQVMSKLGLNESPGFVWDFFKNLAPMLALTFLVGVLYLVFQYTGAFQSSGTRNSSSSPTPVYNVLTDGIKNGVGVLRDFMETYLPFVYQGTHYWLFVFVVFFFIAVALLDKYLLIPTMKRK